MVRAAVSFPREHDTLSYTDSLVQRADDSITDQKLVCVSSKVRKIKIWSRPIFVGSV